MPDHVETILLWGLPASGKSEVRKYIGDLPSEKSAILHVKPLVHIDDYPMVAARFQIDDDRERLGRPRLHTRHETYEDGGFLDETTWDELDVSLVRQYEAASFANKELRETRTTIIECSRGGAIGAKPLLEHGYQRTLRNLPPEMLRNAVIIYVAVPPEESRRKNDERYDPRDPHGILAHRVSTRVMRDNYGCDDVSYLMEQAEEGYIKTEAGLLVPVAVLRNHPEDLTSFVREKGLTSEEKARKGAILRGALEEIMDPLFERYKRIYNDTEPPPLEFRP